MSENLEFNRRVVYTGLKRMSGDRNTVSMGFKRWEGKFSNVPLDIVDVVSDLVSYLGLDGTEKKSLMIGMHAAANRLESELVEVPEYLANGKAPSEPIEKRTEVLDEVRKNSPAYIEVSELFLQTVAQLVRRSDSESFNEMATEIARRGIQGAPSTTQKSLKEWGKSRLADMTFAGNTDKGICLETTHAFYVLLTEFVGPVDADTMVNKAISELLTMDIAQRFNPRELL